MRDLKIYIVIASVLLIIYLVAEYNRPTPVDWRETYSRNDKIPYGTYILYHQLNDIFPSADIRTYRVPIYNLFTENNVDHGDYIIICDRLEITKVDYEELKAFIKRGNNVFIAAPYFGNFLQGKLQTDVRPELEILKVKSKFLSKGIDSNTYYEVGKGAGDYYFSSLDSTAIPLGRNNLGHVNFIKYNFDNGSLFLNANPRLFTNYSLLLPGGAAYAAIALSHMRNTDNVLWDDYYTSGRGDEADTPMRVFLKNKDLKAAYYIALFGLVIFVLYEMKRRQRIIPVIEPLNNTTLDFVNVVGQVYFEQHNNTNIAHKKIAYFLEYLRAKYHVKTNVLDEEFVEKLSQRSGVSLSDLKELRDNIAWIRNTQRIDDKDLIELNHSIEQFYLQSR